MDAASFAEELLAFWLRDHPEISEWDCATAPVPAATDARWWNVGEELDQELTRRYGDYLAAAAAVLEHQKGCARDTPDGERSELQRRLLSLPLEKAEEQLQAFTEVALTLRKVRAQCSSHQAGFLENLYAKLWRLGEELTGAGGARAADRTRGAEGRRVLRLGALCDVVVVAGPVTARIPLDRGPAPDDRSLAATIVC